MGDYDIKAKVTNLRKSGNYFANGYRPAFQIRKDYLATGEITLIGKEKLEVGETAEAYVRFLTPEVYPHSIWKGRIIPFMEGNEMSGAAIVEEVLNEILLKR